MMPGIAATSVCQKGAFGGLLDEVKKSLTGPGFHDIVSDR
jgi:hypothetical protein